jgi:hypothetical protein
VSLNETSLQQAANSLGMEPRTIELVVNAYQEHESSRRKSAPKKRKPAAKKATPKKAAKPKKAAAKKPAKKAAKPKRFQ